MDKASAPDQPPPYTEHMYKGPQAGAVPQQHVYSQQPPPTAYPQHPEHYPQHQPQMATGPYPPQGYGPNYGATHTTNIIVPPTIVATGDCPRCRIGTLEKNFTCLGILCCIFVFPIGIICCLAFQQFSCPNCGATYDT